MNKEVAIAGVTSAPHGSANPPLDTVHTVLAQQHWWGDWEDRIGLYEEGSSNVFQTFFFTHFDDGSISQKGVNYIKLI